jgi:hypothetical protein
MAIVPELVVDTDILVDAGRGIQEAAEYLARRSEESSLAVSACRTWNCWLAAETSVNRPSLNDFFADSKWSKSTSAHRHGHPTPEQIPFEPRAVDS